MADEPRKAETGGKPADVKPAEKPPKPPKPQIPHGFQPGVGDSGIASIRAPKLPIDFEPEPGGGSGGVMPEKVNKD